MVMTEQKFKSLPFERQAEILAELINDGFFKDCPKVSKDGDGWRFDSEKSSIKYFSPRQLIIAFFASGIGARGFNSSFRAALKRL